MRHRNPALYSAVLAVVVACSASERAPSDTSPDTASTDLGPPGERPHPLEAITGLGALSVIVIHADTLRADHLPIYRYARPTTPHIDAEPSLAVFGYHATAPWTLPSTASALLARTPEHHRVVRVSSTPAGEAPLSLAERFSASGYATAVFSGNRVLASDAVLAAGFEVRTEVDDLDDVDSQALASLWENSQEWIESLPDDQPWFLWLQPMDTHPPYRPRAPFRGTWADYSKVPFDPAQGSVEQEAAFSAAYRAAESEGERQDVVQSVRDVYDELVLQQDHAIGEIFAWLRASGRADRTLVVLTADHGETIADDHAPTLSHMVSVRPELVELPLVFFHPSLTRRDARCLSSNIDLGPTLLHALGLDPMLGVDGEPIQEGCRDLVYSSLYVNDIDEDVLQLVAVTDGVFKMDWNCQDGSAAWYHMPSDPFTLSPLDIREVELASSYWEALTAYLRDAREVWPALACPPMGI